MPVASRFSFVLLMAAVSLTGCGGRPHSPEVPAKPKSSFTGQALALYSDGQTKCGDKDQNLAELATDFQDPGPSSATKFDVAAHFARGIKSAVLRRAAYSGCLAALDARGF